MRDLILIIVNCIIFLLLATVNVYDYYVENFIGVIITSGCMTVLYILSQVNLHLYQKLYKTYGRK